MFHKFSEMERNFRQINYGRKDKQSVLERENEKWHGIYSIKSMS